MNYKFSLFDSVKSRQASTIADVDFYRSIKQGRWRDVICQISATVDKTERDTLKSRLPGATPSALCDGGHSLDNVVKPSGLLALDFDLQDNKDVSNFADLKHEIAQVKYIRFCSLSCSGCGYWATMPLIAPERHTEQAKAAIAYFSLFGLQADAKCIDVTRFRFVTYDSEPYYNKKAEPFPFAIVHHHGGITANSVRYTGDDFGDAVKYLDLIGDRDLSSDNADWVKIGYGFAHSFGEDGRELFHRFSKNYYRYDPDECDRRYNGFMRSSGNRQEATVKSFFKLCIDNGIKLPVHLCRLTAKEDFDNVNFDNV
jgi:hypothetical protein